jgi:hypothetical protein
MSLRCTCCSLRVEEAGETGKLPPRGSDRPVLPGMAWVALAGQGMLAEQGMLKLLTRVGRPARLPATSLADSMLSWDRGHRGAVQLGTKAERPRLTVA